MASSKQRLYIPSLSEVKLDVFEFPDIKSLLQSYFQGCKSYDKRLTLRYFSEEAFQKKTPGYWQLVLVKKYKFSGDVINHLIYLMQLQGRQIEYFYTLIQLWELEGAYELTENSLLELEKVIPTSVLPSVTKLKHQKFPVKDEFLKALEEACGDDWETAYAEKALAHVEVEGRQTPLYQHFSEQFHKMRASNDNELSEIQLHCLTSWLHLVIYEMFQMLPEPHVDASWYGEKLSPWLTADVPKIQQCLDDLVKAELIVKTKQGWEAQTPHVRVAGYVSRSKSYFREILDQAKNALDCPMKDRDYYSILIALSEDGFHRIKDILAEEKDKLKAMNDPEGELYSISWQVFKTTQLHNH